MNSQPEIPVKEGRIPFKVPSLEETCFTFYKIFGDPTDLVPLVVLHGGPSAGHGYMTPFTDLWRSHRIPVILYDQIGSGASTRLPETKGDQSLWNMSTYIAELNNLLDNLDLRKNGFHLLGHSWGGILGADFATSRPEGLQKLVLASPVASWELYLRGNELNRLQLPLDCQKAFDEAIRTKDFESSSYTEAFGIFLQKFLIHMDPMPQVMLEGVMAMEADQTAAWTLGGDSCFVPGGWLEGYTMIPRLHRITAPTLVYSAEHDVCHDITIAPFSDLVPHIRRYKLIGSGHIVHLEPAGKGQRLVRLVGDFLTKETGDATVYPEKQIHLGEDIVSEAA